MNEGSSADGTRRGGRAAAIVAAALLAAGSMAAADPTPGASPGGGGDPVYGEYLAAQCITCHTTSGQSHAGIPAVVGLPADAFVDALLAYKNGERDNQVMRSMAGALGLEEIAALAAYFATLSPQ